MATQTSQILTEIAEVAGWEAALKLVDIAGGRSVRIPATPAPDHWLTMALGEEAAAKLCKIYPGSALWIPKNESVVRAFRDRQIREDRRNGLTIAAIAGKYKLTDRQVYNIMGSVE